MKSALIVALLVVCGILAWTGYHLIDVGVSLDYSRQQQLAQKEQIALLRSMLQRATTNLSQDDLIRLLGSDSKHVVKASLGRLEIDSIIFTFHQGTVDKVLLMGEEESESK